MKMDTTGIFNAEMRNFFNADEGAYTAFTDVELKKKTFNVKSVMRKLLISRMGKENIPVVNVTSNQDISFKVCKRAKIYGKNSIRIPCKFSKKGKEEMTIYFNQQTLAEFHAESGDSWYIYFEKDSSEPIIGIMSRDKWSNLFSDSDEDLLQEPDEKNNHELQYSGKIEDMQLIEEAAPEIPSVVPEKGDSVIRSISPEEAARREKNRKKKGNQGELIAIEIEKRRLKALGREDLLDRITHVAKYKDGLGYDLISVDIDSEGKEIEIYIEVKATAGNISMPFYVSGRELAVSQRLRSSYYLYRIYEMAENRQIAKYYKVQGPIDKGFLLTPTEYLAEK